MFNDDGGVKYPRTPHLLSSMTISADDRILKDASRFEGMMVVITEKMDGEHTSLYTHNMHARSITYAYHPSRSWLRQKHAEIAYKIPNRWRVCGENLYAKHSIGYNDLLSYFYVYSIWDENNNALNWDETERWAKILGFPTVPVLYRGIFDKKIIEELPGKLDLKKQEGFVIRPLGDFSYDEFDCMVAKWVRKNHITTDKHWMRKEIVPNGMLKGK